MLEEVENFRDFRVFDFGPYTEIENSENSEIFKTIVYSKECVLSEEVGNFRGFRVFDFGPLFYLFIFIYLVLSLELTK